MKRARTALVVVSGLVALGALLLLRAVEPLIAPVPARIGSAPPELHADSVTIRSQSGLDVRGWYARSTEGKGAVLLLPSVRANRLAMVSRAKFLRAAGYSVLLVDLQATGESAGEAITFGARERLDVRAAVEFLRANIPGEPVGIIGSSLGGAAALLATPPLRVDALVLEAVYPHIDAAIENRLRIRVGPLAPILTPLLVWRISPRLGIAPTELRPVDHVDDVRCPVFIIGGAADRHTTPDDTQMVFAAAREPKQLWMVDGAGHVDFHQIARAEYERRVVEFLAGAFRARRM